MKALRYIEIEPDYCSLTYGVAPCTAALGVTGTQKCFNSPITCQDIEHFTNVPVIHRFAEPTKDLPNDIDCWPAITGISIVPFVIGLGKDLGQRETITVTFSDFQHSDTGAGFDKYQSSRSYTNSFRRGTFFGKFRARQPYLLGRPLRVIDGFVGQAFGDMQVRHYLIDSFSGPTVDGVFTIVAKDILKLPDSDKAQAPNPSDGFLVADITASAVYLTLSPAGAGDLGYPLTGKVAIGNSEIVTYLRDNVTKLILSGAGADGSTSFPDESPAAHAVAALGNVQVDNAQSKFGGTSILFDGTGDGLQLDGSADFAFPAGTDFTIEGFFRPNAVGAAKTIYDSRPNGVQGIYVDVFVDATNHLVFLVNNVGLITGATAVATGQFYHWALCRSGTNTRLFLNGVQQGSTFAGDVNSYLNPAARPIIGNSGNNLASTFSWNGWMDAIRVVKGQAIYTANFTPPVAPHSLIASGGDVLSITRAQNNTVASAHSAQDRVQWCLPLAGNPAQVIYDLLTTYSEVPASYCPIGDWLTETNTFLQRNVSALIAEPTGVADLINELINQLGLAVWPDNIEQLIRLMVLRPISISATAFDQSTVVRNSLGITEQPDKRLSEVWTYYGKINPLLAQDKTENYRSIAVTVATTPEDILSLPAIEKTYSRWIADGGRSSALRVNDIKLARFNKPPRLLNFMLFRGQSDVKLGTGIRVACSAIQDFTGDWTSVNTPAQITQYKFEPDFVTINAEELDLSGIDLDGGEKVITLDADNNNVNLRDLFDAAYPTPVPGDVITFRVEAGVVIGSDSPAFPACDTGDWPAGVVPTLKVIGRLQGAGGRGGNGCFRGPNIAGQNGEAGGIALKVSTVGAATFKLEYTLGALWGGGGGGAGCGASGNFPAGSGGGGSGRIAGLGGNVQGSATNPPVAGDAGTDTTGGLGHPKTGLISGFGGNGGGPGLLGGLPDSGPAAGGLAGSAIDGISKLTIVGATGDRQGAQIN